MAISLVMFICWFIPDLAASMVDVSKSLKALPTSSAVASCDLGDLTKSMHGTGPTSFRDTYANLKNYLQSHFGKWLTQPDNSFELSHSDRYWGSLSCFMCTSFHILFNKTIIFVLILRATYFFLYHLIGKCSKVMTNYLSDLDILLLQLHSCWFRETGMTPCSTVLYIPKVTK